MNALRQGFERGARAAARFTGHPLCFGLAVAVVLTWMLSGPVFGFSDTWQLVINTGTTIVTFLMVFLIQNAQNRDAAAVQIKLDELIRATRAAENALLDLEELDEDALERFRKHYEDLACKARDEASRRKGRPAGRGEAAPFEEGRGEQAPDEDAPHEEMPTDEERGREAPAEGERGRHRPVRGKVQ